MLLQAPQRAAQMWNGLFACAAFLLLVWNAAQASASWASPNHASAYGLETGMTSGGWGQPSVQPGGWDYAPDQPLLYPPASAISLPAHATMSDAYQPSAPVAVPTQRLTLEDLPVESEGQQQAPGASAGLGLDRKQKNALRSVLSNLLRKPTLAKILVLIAVFAASFFLVGILSRIAQLVISVWAALKALQILEEHQKHK